MIDHVGLRFSDFAASTRFYDTLLSSLEIERTYTSDGLIEWNDLAIGPEESDRAVVQGLHLGFAAPSAAHVDAARRAMADAGYGSDDDGFMLDLDGNTVEAVHHEDVRTTGIIDHVSIRVADIAASRAFYSRIGGLSIAAEDPARVRFAIAGGGSLSVVSDGRPLTENLHLAFDGTADDVRAFHADLTGAGYRDNGAPGFRPDYHEGYYAAFVLDPDGHNIEVVDHHH